ncbi:MAG: IclR family transcriptional regulator [Paracoccus sp. (in: a-proteobacteria)]|uniref:IclR family transcriptional regulator n=1 Tax=Paracoccus sp. TaxID=267 RepID=UPI0026DF1B59|nr:IclR family transcriptional regulator [Paracoccus sp. (in: a-proteobacteria)]MDO5612319.1 IclR family transcriptional regulator [Paracoccus sp. (in: a-proteobacteria)]
MTAGGQAHSDGTVGRALAVLDLVAEFDRPVRFAELLPPSGLPKATLYRFLQVLTRQDMLFFDEDRQTYAPGIRLVRLAHAAWACSSLAPLARDVLDRLADDLGQTVHLAQLDNGAVLYVDKRNAAQPVEMFSQSGKVGPAYCTGVGKAMLAYLPDDRLAEAISRQSFHRHTPNTLTTPDDLRADLARIRERGYALDDQEHEAGIACIAAPILSGSGRMLGALSVTTTTATTSRSGLLALAGPVIAAARDIGEIAGAWRFPERQV